MTPKKTHRKTIFKEIIELLIHIILFVGMVAISVFNISINAEWQTIVSSITAGVWFILIIADIKTISKARGSIETIEEIEADKKKQTEETR